MSFFDFSDEIDRIREQSLDEASRLSARTVVGRRRFPDAVTAAGFTLLRPRQLFQPDAASYILVIGIATWSDPDLLALETLAKQSRDRDIKVVVFDVDDWPLADVLETFPGASRFRSTPIVLEYRLGLLGFTADGHDAMLWLDQF